MNQDKKPTRLAEHFTASENFTVLFSSGMDLVEETASFLDTDGREASKLMSKAASGIYGAESMRLTTRLMQVASWLLLQRAVTEGEMSFDQALLEKKNMKLNQLHSRVNHEAWNEMPETFLSLIERSVALQKRVLHLDAEIYGDRDDNVVPFNNPVASQRALLETAFDRRFS